MGGFTSKFTSKMGVFEVILIENGIFEPENGVFEAF
jgi:hypothetical protein